VRRCVGRAGGQACTAGGKQGRRIVHAGDRVAAARERKRDAPGPHAEFEHAPARVLRDLEDHRQVGFELAHPAHEQPVVQTDVVAAHVRGELALMRARLRP
jgi:hypothetical protein